MRTTTEQKSTTAREVRAALVAGTAVFAIVLGVQASGQQPGQDIRSTQIATVNFMLVAKDGQPIEDLKAEEVTLRIDGKVRPIRTLQFLRVSSPIGAPAAGTMADKPATDVAPAFASNLTTAAVLPRSIVIVVDDETMPIGQEQKLRSVLTKFVSDLPAEDQVALVTVPHGGIKVGLTADRDRLRKEIASISPISPIDEPACRTQITLSTLQTTVEQLTRTSEQPVTVAFLSSSLTGASQMEMAPNPRGGGQLSAQGGACALRADDFVRVGQAVAAVRAQLYIIHPDYSQQPVQEGIENLRGQTGAPLFHLSSGAEPGLNRMARETSAYYVATFDTEPDELTGKPHPASIKTTRKDADVRDRPFLVVGRATPTVGDRPAASTTVTTAYDMLRSGRQYRDLPLRATATSFRNSDGTINVVGLFEPIDGAAKIMSASAALIDENGKGIALWPKPNETATMTFGNWPMAIGLTVVPGNYRLRIAAIDSNGRLGLVDDKLVAELPKAGPVQISQLMLGVPKAGGGITPRLEFAKEDSAMAYLELYGATEGAQVAAMFEVARTTNGPAFLTLKGVFAALNEDGKYGITTTIPLSSLAPGDYVVRAIVQAVVQGKGQPAARVIRTLHKIG